MNLTNDEIDWRQQYHGIVDPPPAAPAPEPVAWMNPNWPKWVNTEDAFESLPVEGFIPLYAHPAPVAAPSQSDTTDSITALARKWWNEAPVTEVQGTPDGDAIMALVLSLDLQSPKDEARLRAAVERVITERDNAVNSDKARYVGALEWKERAERAEEALAAECEVNMLHQAEIARHMRERDEAHKLNGDLVANNMGLRVELNEALAELRDFQEHDKHYLEGTK